MNSQWGHDPSPAITFDLGALRPIEMAEIWNGHEAERAIKRVLVETSADGNLARFGNVAFGRVNCRYGGSRYRRTAPGKFSWHQRLDRGHSGGA